MTRPPIGSPVFDLLAALAHEQGADPLAWAAVLYHESGFNPQKQNNKGADAWGLNQMSGANLRELGFTADSWKAAGYEGQLPVIGKWWRALGASPAVKYASRAHLLAANFLPGRLPNDPAKVDAVLTYAGEVNPKTGKLLGAYEENAIFDPDHTGRITIRTIGQYLDAYFAADAKRGGDWQTAIATPLEAAIGRAIIPAPPAPPVPVPPAPAGPPAPAPVTPSGAAALLLLAILALFAAAAVLLERRGP